MGSSEILVQAGLFLLALVVLLSLQSLPKRCLSRLRRRSSSSPHSQSQRHFFAGAHLLARATASKPSSSSSSATTSLLKSAIAEADSAIALDPRDAAPHILRALALRHLGRPLPAIRSLDLALSSPQSKSLSPKERADALVKRAELHLQINRRRRADQALADLAEAVAIRGTRDGKVECVFGECYEAKGMREEAKAAYERAVAADDSLLEAREGLRRLVGSSESRE